MALCKLCNNDRVLVESHIIPKFVFNWMKKTGSRYFRKADSPNLRIQDGLKNYLFCTECEQIFGSSEKWFSENIFHSYLSNQQHVFIYEELLSKFMISLLWRILLLDIQEPENKFSHFSEIKEAFEEWKSFLLFNKIPKVYNEIHLFLIPDTWGAAQPHRYVSRYFSRDIDGHVIELEGECWVYVKFARFMFFGKIKNSKRQFRNTQVGFQNGITSLGQYIDGTDISNYLIERAGALHTYYQSKVSPKQMEIIENYMERNYEKIKNSDLGKRIIQDFTATVNPNLLSASFNYLCDVCAKEISEPNGYLLRTFEILLSKSYFTDFFKREQLTRSKDDLEIRTKIFQEIANQNNPWVICDDCSSQFDFDKIAGKKFMQEWIKEEGDYKPPKSENFREYITQEQMEDIALMIVTI